MKFNMLMLAALLAPAVHAEPFFSEYVEGSSNNKALEIYNPDAVSIDLSSYSIKMFFNGATTASKTINLTGTLQPGATLVITDTAAAAALAAKSNLTMGTGNFNGDDAIGLYKGSTLVDVFGQIGVDPGTGWGANGNVTIDKTLVRKASISQGDSNGSDAFDPSIEWEFFAKDTFDNLGSHTGTATGGGSGGGTGGTTPPAVVIGACNDSATKISVIQGVADVSLKAGETLVVEAVVSKVVPSASGFYIQEETADQDTDSATSEGLFVFNDTATDYPSVGNKVRVVGKVEEYFKKTQLRRAGLVDCGVGEAVQSTELTLPVASINDFEKLESMLVRLPQSLVVTDLYDLGTYGEMTLSSKRLFTPTNQFRPSSADAIALADSNNRDKLILDDMQPGKNPAVVKFPAPALSMNNPVRNGDTVAPFAGVLDYSFSAWRVLPEGTVNFTATNARQEQPVLRNVGTLKVGSANVLNFFNGDGFGGGFPTQRGATDKNEYERQAAKMTAVLTGLNADVLGLMEVENDGYGSTSAIKDLVDRLNAVLGANTYNFVQVPGTTQLGSDAITVAMIYKPATVTPVGSAVTTNAGVFGYGNRQPLVQTFKQNSNGEVFTLAVNHFKSKGSCPTGSTNVDRDMKDGQGCWNATRVQAATELLAWLATNPTGTADKDVLIVGDLNSYAKEDPIVTLSNGGFINLIEKFHGQAGYSYQFNGELGYLDHALASTSLSGQVSYAMEWHINADESTLFDYNTELKTVSQQADYYAPSAFRASDHDPVLVELKLAGNNPADLDVDGDVDNNDVLLFNKLLRSGSKLPLKYDFNKDGKVDALDARAMLFLCTYPNCAIK